MSSFHPMSLSLSNIQLGTLSFSVGLTLTPISWCKQCKVITPKFEALSERLPQIKFASVDMETGEKTLTAGVPSIPAFYFYRAGEVVSRFAGAIENQRNNYFAANL